MGITGLIQFIENASTRTNIKNFKGKVVCVDAYCWLHKGVYACSETLAMGGTTDIHIKYCLKYINMLMHHHIKPVLVFDGQHLPAKQMTEIKRRESRKQAKTRAAELLRLGKKTEARKYFNRCVDVSHAMALELMKECRKLGVDCIVAPYEADAQLAFLNISGIADYVITEDSDLILFGCKKILFKLDLMGNCLEVDNGKLHLTMGCSLEKYSFQKFRYMCIMSGCDYLESLPGIGLAKACKFILKTEEEDMNKALDKIPAYLNMRHLEVTPEYKLNFMRANATFMHMFVYDPKMRKMVRLTNPSEHNTDIEYCCNAGSILDDKTAFQLAIGNLDPFTLKNVHNWIPEAKIKSDSTKQNFPSIWEFRRHSQSGRLPTSEIQSTQRSLSWRKNALEELDFDEDSGSPNLISPEETVARENDLLSSYTTHSPQSNKRRLSIDQLTDDISSIKVPKRNPFYQPQHKTNNAANMMPLTKTVSPVKRSNSTIEKPKVARSSIVISRFFSKVDIKTDKKPHDTDSSSQNQSKQIEEKFRHVKSLYERNINDTLSLYNNTDESKCAENSCDVGVSVKSENVSDEIIEVLSDCEDDRKVTKNLSTFAFSKKISKSRVPGLKKPKTGQLTNQPSLTQFLFTKKAAM